MVRSSPAISRAGTAHPGQEYRPDIDGLRAVAVLPILFNHAGVRGFGGGYIGVDIFFVISGFLITGIVTRDIALGRFSVAEFYRRRVLRIFPALFVMLALVSVVALLALMPGELVRFARSVAATTLFVSNIFFFSEVGYFDLSAHAKPLLHTWSLGIEEQFYILWPLMLALVGAGRTRLQRGMVIGVSLISLVVADAMVRTDMAAAFYLLPARAWELGLGGMLAVFPHRIRARWINEALALLGVLLIVYAIRRFAPPIAFPGLTALVPCLGAALLIFAGPATAMARLLSLWPVVFTGRISYSLYLWHWPVIVFAELWLFLDATPMVIGGEILLSFLLATLSWRYVETPFRTGARGWPTRRVLLGGGATMAAMLAAVGMMSMDGGLSSRFTPRQNALDRFAGADNEANFRRGSCFVVEADDRFDARQCLTPHHGGKPVVLLVGDSMAAAYWPGLSRHVDRFDVLQATIAGCRPNLYPDGSERRCAEFYRRILLEWLPAHRPDAVIMTGNWQPKDVPLLRRTLPELRRRGVRLLLVGPPPQYRSSVPRLLVFAERRGDPGLADRALIREGLTTDREMAKVAAEAGVPYFSPMAHLCHDGRCRMLASPGVPIQFDFGHPSPQGSQILADALLPALAQVAGR